MSTAERIVYGESNEASTPLTEETYRVQPQNKGCSLKAKLAVAAAGLIALGLGSIGLYFGLKQNKAAKMPSYSVKYAIALN